MARRVDFLIADVFAEALFAGNTLAVVPDARDVDPGAMQRIAFEFGFAETAFVLPPTDPKHTARVRIFTPRKELPFAGHPTIGTTAVLAARGLLDGNGVVEVEAGPLRVFAERAGEDAWSCRFSFEPTLELPREAPSPDVASALGLAAADVRSSWFAGIGVRFCFVEVGSKAVVDAALLDRARWSAVCAAAWASNVYLFAGDPREGAVYVRMFAPALGVDEDPATGSAAAVLAASVIERANVDRVDVRIRQGVLLGRPSSIHATAERSGTTTTVAISGRVLIVAEGRSMAG